MRQRAWLLALTACVAVAGCKLIANKGGATPSQAPPPGDATGAGESSSAGGQGAGSSTGELPPRLVELIQEQYKSLQADQIEQIYAEYRPVVAEFEQRWPAYAQRKQIVDAAVAKAQKLKQAGKLADAQAALEAVITRVELGDGTPERQFLEPRDAEWAALQELVGVAVARRSEDYSPLPALLRAAAALWVRRPVGSRDDEMWLYFAQHEGTRRAFRTLGQRDQEPARAVAALEAMTENNSTPGGRGAMAALKEGGASDKLLEYVDGRKGNYHNPSPNKMFVEVASAADSFLTQWRAYRERAAAVATAVNKADALEKAGKLAEARAVLEAVVTPPPAPDSNGKLSTQRGYVEVIDAELPALRALERVLAKQKDVAALSQMFAYRFVRRAVTTLDEELGAHLLRDGRAYDGRGGRALVPEVWRVFEENGVASGNSHKEGIAKGVPMLLYADVTEGTLKLSGKAVSWDYSGWYTQYYDCHLTDQIERIESDGYVRYKETCKTRKKKAHFSIDAKLVEPAPEWASSVRWLYVAGKVSSPGPRWKLTDARVIDMRFQ